MRQPIIDSHIHFWDPNLLSYPWLARQPAINRPFLPADLLEQAQEVDLQGIVFVQAGANDADGFAEAKWVTALAAAEPRIMGIVAFAPLEQGEAVRPHLDALAKLPLVKGIRRLIQTEGVDFCIQPDFVRGVQLLSEYGYSFDLGIRSDQLANSIRLVEQCPGVLFVVDHFGKPAVAGGVMDPWREELVTLAGLPNVYCKISGLATEADRDNWTREQLKPYIEHALDAFDVEGVMYGGDWPVSTLAIGYQEWIGTVNWAAADIDDTARRMLFVDNAVSFYRLEQIGLQPK